MDDSRVGKFIKDWKWPLFVAGMFVALLTGKSMDMKTEANLVMTFLCLAPSAFIIYLFRKKTSGGKILLISFGLLCFMHFVAETVGHRYAILETNYAPSQQGAGAFLGVIIFAWLSVLIAYLGVPIRSMVRYFSLGNKPAEEPVPPEIAEAAALQTVLAGGMLLKSPEIPASGYKLHPAVIALAGKIFAPEYLALVLGKLKSSPLQVDRVGPAPRIHLAVLWLSKGDPGAFEARIAEAQKDPLETLAAAGLAGEDWRAAATRRGVDCTYW